MKFMDKLSAVLERYLMPVASFIGGQKHLIAMRDGFIASLTVSMAGAMSSMFNNVLFKPDSLIGKELNKIEAYASSVQPILDKYVITCMNQIWWGTLAIISLFLLISISYSLAKQYEVDGLSAALISFASYFVLMRDTAGGVFNENPDAPGEFVAGGWGLISWGVTNSNAMFACIIVALISTQLFVTFTKKGWVIKMPDQVPPAVSKAFAAVLPGCITLVIMGVVSTIFLKVVEVSYPEAIQKWVQDPLMSFGQSPATYILLIFIAQLLWFFGLHGSNMIDPAMNSLYKPALYSNIDAVNQGLEPQYALTRNFLDVYAMPGGSGGTLALIIAIVLFSKRQESRELAKLAIAPGIFQINEPVIFGLPIVLNATYFLPFLLIPPIMCLIAWIFTEVIPFADYLCMEAPWTTPPILSAFLGTNGDWKATVLAAALLVLAIVLWTPFVIAANKMGENQDA